MYAIYKVKNRINGKYYIGHSKNTLKRWGKHKYLAQMVKNGAKIGDSSIQLIHIKMYQYGIENFNFRIIEEVDTLEEANIREGHWELYYNSLVPNGYNVKPGGNVRPITEATRKKISESNKGKSKNVGHPVSLETRKKISKTNKETWKIKSHSEETMKKISPTFFKKGHDPWNKGMKGLRVSPETEFKKGLVPWNKGTKGIMKPPPHAFKKGHVPMHKLPDEIREKIKQDKRSSREVAKEFGIGKTTVLRIRKE